MNTFGPVPRAASGNDNGGHLQDRGDIWIFRVYRESATTTPRLGGVVGYYVNSTLLADACFLRETFNYAEANSNFLGK